MQLGIAIGTRTLHISTIILVALIIDFFSIKCISRVGNVGIRLLGQRAFNNYATGKRTSLRLNIHNYLFADETLLEAKFCILDTCTYKFPYLIFYRLFDIRHSTVHTEMI